MAEITIKSVEGNPLNINVVMTAVEHSMLNGEIVTETVDFYPDTSKPVRAYLDSVTARKQYCPTTYVDGNIVYLSCDNATAGVYTLTITCTDTNGKARRYKSDACIEVYDLTSAAEIAGTFDEQTYEMNGVFYTFGGGAVQSDWDETNPESPAYILNKPDLSDYATDEELQAVEEQIPNVPEWAMQPQKPSYTAGEVGAVPTSRTVNGKALSEDITLNAQDVGAQTPIADLAQIREGAAKGATAYQKPSTGIAKSDLTNGIQQSLDRADTALQAAALTPLQNQIDTINNKIPTDATSTNELADKNYVERLVNEKQDTINDLDAIRRGAAKGATAYQLPSNGMPKTDLAVGVQQSLDKANTAYQKPSAGIPKTDLAQEIQQRLDIPIDDEPTAGSNNLVKSGGVFDRFGHIYLYNDLFVYQETNWETIRRFYNKSLNYGDKILFNVQNNTGERIDIRITYSDDTTQTVQFNSGNTSTEVSKEGVTIKTLFAYFLANARPNGNLVVEANYNNAFDISNLKTTAERFTNIETSIAKTVFVNSSNPTVRGFFKELYIIPKYPNDFDISSTTLVSIYRGYQYPDVTRWYIEFTTDAHAKLSALNVTSSPEGESIVTLSNTSSSTQRFEAYAVVDWSQLDENTRILGADVQLQEACLDLKFSPLIHYNQVASLLINNGYKYKGVILDPSTANQQASYGKEFYVISGPGTYTNFGGKVLPYGYIGILKHDSQWELDTIDINPYLGKVVAYNGNFSKSASGTSWETVRRFYHGFSSYGKNIKLSIQNDTGSPIYCKLGYDGAPDENFTITSDTTEKIFNSSYSIREIYLFFAADAEPEGNLNITISCNNFYHVEQMLNSMNKFLSISSTGSVSTGNNLLVKADGWFKAGETYYIKIDGDLDSRFLIRGSLNNVITELGVGYCGCIYKRTLPSDFSDIRIALNSVQENGTATITILGENEWKSICNLNDVKIKSCGLSNKKKSFKSGFDCHTEIVGPFIENTEYEINISGTAGTNNFTIFLFSAEETEIYRSTISYSVGGTYVFKCPHNADKMSMVRNKIVSDVNIDVTVVENSVAIKGRQLPNYVGIPIAAHQGIFYGGLTIGSPMAWNNARNLGYKWIECDIQFTSDNIAVFLHDSPINLNGDYIINKTDNSPVDKNDNITVGSLTYRQLKDTYRWADGGEILSLVEGFGYLSMLGMNCVLEFKSYPDNVERREYLKTACRLFGTERIIYNATSTDYKIIFPTLINLGIYQKGEIALTSSNEVDMEAAFAYAQQIGNTSVMLYGINQSGGINTEFAQRMMKKYNVQYAGDWGSLNTNYQTSLIVSNDIAPVKDNYTNIDTITSNDTINNTDYITKHSFTINSVTNVNINMIADEGVSVRCTTTNKVYYGCVSVAFILQPGTYQIQVNGVGHIAELSIRY